LHGPSHLRRAAVAAAGAALLIAGAALLIAGAAGAVAGSPQPGTGHSRAAAPDIASLNPAMAPGSELRFVAVAPCRIIDTRIAGGKITAGSRVFDVTLSTYRAQGGKAGTCNIPDVATAVQLNLGAISQNHKTSDIRGWATGTAEPTASLVNYNPSGPVANMVTMPVNASGQFTLKTPGSAQVFADVAGYYVKPLYASIDGTGGTAQVYAGVASGLVGETRDSVGEYTLTFDRNVTKCVAVATDYLFTPVHEISVDSDFSQDSTVYVSVKDSSTGNPDDTIFHLSLTC
jgi:hypothetical protein